MNGKNVDDARTHGMLSCLAAPSRVRLVRAISEADRCVSELAISVGLSQSCTTRHLQALERAGLVKGRRDGRRVRFSLVADAEDSRSILGLVLGDDGIPEPGSGWSAKAGFAGGQRPESGARTRRRAKPLAKGDLGSSEGDRPGRGGPSPDPESAMREAEAGWPSTGARPIRRQDIEDYLL